MWGNITQFLHSSVSDDSCCIDWERSHHADQVSLEKSSCAMSFVTVTETLQSWLVLWISEVIGLHQCLYVIERVVECPIHCSSDTACNKWNVNWQVCLVRDSCWGQCVCYLFDCCEIQSESRCFSDRCWCLTSVQTLESVLLEDFNNSIQRSWVHLVNGRSLNLNSYTSVFDGTL